MPFSLKSFQVCVSLKVCHLTDILRALFNRRANDALAERLHCRARRYILRASNDGFFRTGGRGLVAQRLLQYVKTALGEPVPETAAYYSTKPRRASGAQRRASRSADSFYCWPRQSHRAAYIGSGAFQHTPP